MRFVGLDLAWSARHPSGGVVLRWEGEKALSYAWNADLGDDGEIVAWATAGLGRGGGLVAIDAPLLVPNETGTRPADRELSAAYRRQEAGAYPANRRLLGPAIRGEVLTRKFQARGFTLSPRVRRQEESRQVVEVYPHPALIELFGLTRTLKYKARPRRSLEQRWTELRTLRDLLATLALREPALEAQALLGNLEPWGHRGRSLKRLEDLLDALTCAYVALHLWYWGEGGYRTFGDPGSGFILVPIRPPSPSRPVGRE